MAPTTPTRPRRGIALPIALGAIILIGLLVAAIAFLATTEFRVARTGPSRERAVAAADYGPRSMLRNWKRGWNLLAPGDTTPTRVDTVDAATRTIVRTRATAVQGGGYWLTAVATSGRGLVAPPYNAESVRRTGFMVRLDRLGGRQRSAVVVNGPTQFGSNSSVQGDDQNPAGWGCDPEAGLGIGVVASDTLATTTQGGNCAAYHCVTGSPVRAQDVAVADTSTILPEYGMTYEQMKAEADIAFPPGVNLGASIGSSIGPVVSNGACMTGQAYLYNWGDPARSTPAGPCESYMPIVWVRGDLFVANGDGQGILLVDGDLRVTGQFSWHGLIIVRGKYTATGSGAHVVGSLWIANVNNEQNDFGGSSSVVYSRCTVRSAIRYRASPVPIRRAWAEMF